MDFECATKNAIKAAGEIRVSEIRSPGKKKGKRREKVKTNAWKVGCERVPDEPREKLKPRTI